jgi:hypothetical protein
VKTIGADGPPPGPIVDTVTLTVLGAATSDAGTIAVSCVGLTYAVTKRSGPKLTLEHGSSPVPLTVRVNCGVRAGTDVGVPTVEFCAVEEMAGAGRADAGVVMVNSGAFDVPEDVETETEAVPGNAASEGWINAVSWLALTKLVWRAGPVVEGLAKLLQFNTEPFTKLDPFTVSVNPFGPQ